MKKMIYLFALALSIYNSHAEQNCFGVVCAVTACQDGGPRAPYVNNCCSCHPKRFGFDQNAVACGAAVCSHDLCPDGRGRSHYQGDCCSCNPNRHFVR